MSKFLEINASNDATERNQWFEHCRQKNIPYVIVNLMGNTASVEWDYITYPIGSEKLFTENEPYLQAELMKIYDKYSTKSSMFSISASVASFAGLPIQHAKAAAIEIFELIDSVVKNETR